MKTIKFPVYGIELLIDEVNPVPGSICCSPDLYETCPRCGRKDCISSLKLRLGSCEGAHVGEVETEEQVSGRIAYNGAVDGILSMILAHAVAGLAVELPAYLEGIETALQAASENL